MGAAIPADWDGESYRCIQLTWPSSPAWTAILMGLLTLPGRGRYWDERTGSIRAVQTIARQLFELNYPFTSCDDGESIPPVTPEQQMIYRLGGDDESEDDDMGCNPCIRWNDGVLEVLICGEWQPVPGEAGSVDDNLGEDPLQPPGEEEPPTYYACGKATAAAAIVREVAEAIWDARDVMPWKWISTVESQVGLNLDNRWIISGCTQANTMAGLEYQKNEVISDGLINWLKCQLVTKFADNADSATDDDWYSARKLVNGHVAPDVFSMNYWDIVFMAIGKKHFKDAAALGATTEGDCGACEDVLHPPEAPRGKLRFTGSVTKNTGDGSITGIVSNGGSKIDLTWSGTEEESDQYTSIDVLLGVVSDTPITYASFKYAGVDTPVAEWWETYVSPLRDFVQIARFNILGEVLSSPFPNLPHPTAITLSTFPEGSPTVLLAGGKKNPKDPGGSWSVTWSIEIVDAG